MYPQSFLREEAKIKQRTSSKKQLCEIGEAIWDSRFTSFYFVFKYFSTDIKNIFFKWILQYNKTFIATDPHAASKKILKNFRFWPPNFTKLLTPNGRCKKKDQYLFHFCVSKFKPIVLEI